MDNRYRNRNSQQDYRDPYGRRSQQEEQFSQSRDDQYGETGYREGLRNDYQRFDNPGRNDWSRETIDYRSDTAALDDYDRTGFGRSQPRGPDRVRDYRTSRNMTGYRTHDYGSSSFGSGSFDRALPPRQFDRDERGFFDRASDEVMSWFGDDDAARRREMDHRADHRGKGPAGYTRSTERILEDANERLMHDRGVDASSITVTCDGSDVTLTGTVSSRSEKRRAEDIVEDIAGVKHVQNNLRVETRESYYSKTSTLSDS